MSIQVLTMAQPFFEIDYVEQEESYFVEKKSIVINLSREAEDNILVNRTKIPPLHSTIVEQTVVENIHRALVVKDYMKYDISDPEIQKMITSYWKSLYQWSGREAQKGIPYHKTEKIQLTEDTAVTVCYAAAMSPSGPHKEHAVELDEVHAQIQGIGRVQMFRENDTNTLYQEYYLAPGNTHDMIFDENGVYPWHQYHSVTASIYIPIEVRR